MKDLTEQMQAFISEEISLNENGDKSYLDSYIELGLCKKRLSQTLEMIKIWETENIDEIMLQCSEVKDGYRGFRFEVRQGGKGYDYKHIKEWVEAKEKLKSIEDKCKQAYNATSNKLMVASEDGEEIQMPKVTFRKGSVIMKYEK